MDFNFSGVLSILANLLSVMLALIGLAILMLVMLGIGWAIGRAKAKAGGLQRDKTGIITYNEQTRYELRESVKKLKAEEEKGGWFGGGKKGDEDKPFHELAQPERPVAVLTFDGDIRASRRKVFASLVDEVLVNKDSFSEVVVAANSPGGAIAEYGLVYAEMERLRNTGVPLTVCIDTYGASGGYLMSLPANKIVSAPFAMIGSVGVVAYAPNIHRFLKKHDVDPRLFTAGEYKRTVTLIGEDDEESRRHFQEQLETIHSHFVAAVKKYRPDADIDKVKTGDHWTADESMQLNLGLVDEIATSRDYILRLNQDRDLVLLSQKKPVLPETFGRAAAAIADELAPRLVALLRSPWF